MARARLSPWLALLRDGDVLMLALAVGLALASFVWLWRDGVAEEVVIRANGQVFARLSLRHDRRIEVPGPLGVTEVQIAAGRARILRDPSPRQYCVRQGWLMRPGEIAICAPNRVSVQIAGRTKVYDSISY